MSEEIHGNPLSDRGELWPDLPLDAWKETYATLHLWTQIIGKIRLKLSPHANHWWNVTLYLTSRGLTTSPIPYGSRIFQMDFDFLDHELRITTDFGDMRTVELKPRTVADFYAATMSALGSLDIRPKIWTTPVEIPDRTPFELDEKHASYDPVYARRCWKILVQTDRVFKDFRSSCIGKISPVHFFWGAFDLAVTRFSGRRAPDHPGGPDVGRFVMLEAYSHEVSSAGFWPGVGLGMPAFYAYAYPESEAYREYPVRPEGAFYHEGIKEFILPYDTVRLAEDPDRELTAFLFSTYEAAAVTGNWDRPALERGS
jgi:hypothetical protein